MALTVARIDRHTIELPYREVPNRNMRRALPHWTYLDIFEIELSDGTVGYGEDMLYYGWGTVATEDIERATGQHAMKLLFDDSLGSLQIGLFDAVGKALKVPVYELIGAKHRSEVPISWWCIDMPAADWIHECELAIDRGYTSVKLKGRPWQDIRHDVADLCAALPAWFSIGIDFNGTLLEPDRALPILEELVENPQVSTIETPIPHGDVDGNRRIARELDVDIAHHNGRGVSELTQVQTNIADTYVLGTGGPDRLIREAGFAEFAQLPFWIQNLGPITGVFWAHVGATMPNNTRGNIICDHLFAETPVANPLAVRDGALVLEDNPGLGIALDHEVIDEYLVDRPTERPEPDRLVRTTWPDREPIYAASGTQLEAMATDGTFPYFEPGVETQLVPDDGSDAWKETHRNALEEPVVGEVDGLSTDEG